MQQEKKKSPPAENALAKEGKTILSNPGRVRLAADAASAGFNWAQLKTVAHLVKRKPDSVPEFLSKLGCVASRAQIDGLISRLDEWSTYITGIARSKPDLVPYIGGARGPGKARPDSGLPAMSSASQSSSAPGKRPRTEGDPSLLVIAAQPPAFGGISDPFAGTSLSSSSGVPEASASRMDETENR